MIGRDVSQAGESSRKAWTVMSIMLTALNVLGLLLASVAIWGMNRWIESLLSEYDAALPTLTVWVLSLRLWMLAVPFGLLALLVLVSEVFVSNKKTTTTLNVVVAVGMGVVLAAWVVAIVVGMIAPLAGG